MYIMAVYEQESVNCVFALDCLFSFIAFCFAVTSYTSQTFCVLSSLSS